MPQQVFRISEKFGGILSALQDGERNRFPSDSTAGVFGLIDIENFQPKRMGGFETVPGFETFRNLGTGAVEGLFDYKKANGSVQKLVVHDGKLKDITGTTTVVGSGIATGVQVTWTVAYDKVIICDGVNVPWTYDGTTFAALSTDPAQVAVLTGARQAIFYRNRLWLFRSTADRSTLFYSAAGNITTGYDANLIPCDPDDGQNIVGIEGYFLPVSLNPIIAVHKEQSFGIVTGSDPSTDPFTFAKVNKESGGTGPFITRQLGQDFLYLTRRGVLSYKTDIADVNLQFSQKTEGCRDKFLAFDNVAIAKAVSWYDPKNYRVCFAVPEAGSAVNNVVWCMDTESGGWYKMRFGTGQDVRCAFVTDQSDVYLGASNGRIYRFNVTARTFAGETIKALMQTDYLHFGSTLILKRIIAMQVAVKAAGRFDVYLTPYFNNGERTGTREVAFSTFGATYNWGEGVWTDNPEIYQWGAPPIKITKALPKGQFRSVSLKLEHTAEYRLELFDVQFVVDKGSGWR